MSGFEVAGVALAVLPILFAVLNIPASPKTLMAFRKRAYVGKLARALLLQKQTIAENIKSIASMSGCQHVWLLDDDPFTYLLSKQVQEQVLEYLGEENYAALSGVLSESQDILKRIAGSIEGLVPGGKGPSDDLLAIIDASREANGKPSARARIKLLFKGKELIDAVKDLDDTTAQIDRFTRILISNQHTARSSPSRKAAKLAKTLRRFREAAGNMHIALDRGWASGCHTQHEANLFLEDRLSSAAALLDRTRKPEKKNPILHFPLMITIPSHAGPSLTYETSVQVYKEDEECCGPEPPEYQLLGRQATTSTQVTLVTPSTHPQPTSDVILVESICGVLEQSDRLGMPRRASLVLAHKQYLGVSCCGETHAPFVKVSGGKLTLRDILPAPGTQSSPHKTPLKSRIFLALGLASNLLQLFQTRWLQNPWSKDELYFPLRPKGNTKTAPGPGEGVNLDQPFISVTFGEDNLNSTATGAPNHPFDHDQQPPSHPIDAKQTLLELGILLLEIWHQEPFETRLPSSIVTATGSNARPLTSGSYYQRLAAAIEWLDDTTDPMPEQYDRAASLCIRGVIGGDSRLADWDDMAFWTAMCADVIEPLQRNCRPWQRGGGSG